MELSLLDRLKRFDDERPSFPGEHWLALGAGLWLITRQQQSMLGRLAAVAAGAALVYRAASGRDGLARLVSRRFSRRSASRKPRPGQRYVDIAAPWPYNQRVRVSAISQPIGKTIWTP